MKRRVRKCGSATMPKIRITFEPATARQAAVVAKIRSTAAANLTAKFGMGHWSSQASANGVRLEMKFGTVFLATRSKKPVAALTLTRKKPWAHDRSYFSNCKHPLFLIGMAVIPAMQRKGVGAECIDAMTKAASAMRCDAICLDAYDHAAGAGEFYRKCGFREVGRVAYRGTPLVYFELLL
jgi:GNAT superfamily N-acetyltransferase